MPKAICHEHIKYPVLFCIICLILQSKMCWAAINNRLRHNHNSLTREELAALHKLKQPLLAFRKYEVFRFYNYAAQAWLSKKPGKNLVVANATDPADDALLWEWIPVATGITRLRNQYYQKYLCFNKLGKPILRRRPKPRSCNLAIYHYYPYYTILNHHKRYAMGFCKNGHPFVRRRPQRNHCKLDRLLPSWNKFLLCDRVPYSCISGCQGELYDNKQSCSRFCKSALACQGIRNDPIPDGLPPLRPI